MSLSSKTRYRIFRCCFQLQNHFLLSLLILQKDIVVGLGDKGVRSPSGAISPNSLSPNYLKAQANSPAKSKIMSPYSGCDSRQEMIAQVGNVNVLETSV